MDPTREVPPVPPVTPRLTELEAGVLAFERRRWRYAGAKEAAVRDEFRLSMTRYYQVLNHLLDRPEALAVAPVTVGRLRRLRDARRELRNPPRTDPS